ncbi:MAG: MinD/ParA family protein, partial [Planctomycetes bacterium]|nr:MinD/ParA family protein [Planctomycetota bacterium]
MNDGFSPSRLIERLSQHGNQARQLRAMFEKRQFANSVSIDYSAARNCSAPAEKRFARSVLVSSGKAGVGKSVLALNLAIAMARRGESVCLIDASSSVGHVQLMCGQTGYWNLTHAMSGIRDLNEIVMQGPCGIRLISGVLRRMNNEFSQKQLVPKLSELERQMDWLIVDTSS